LTHGVYLLIISPAHTRKATRLGQQPGKSDAYDSLVIVCLQVLAISNNASLHALPVPTATSNSSSNVDN